VGGIFLQTQYRKGYSESKHIVTDAQCKEKYACDSSRKRGVQQRQTCTDCAVTGKFGTLHRTYKSGTEPGAGGEVVVFKAPSGELTLEPGLPNWLPILLYVGGIGSLVGAAVLFALRDSKWFRRAQGVNLGLSLAGR